MAKNLNFNVKNTQLAAVLKKNKQKSEPLPEKESEAPPTTKPQEGEKKIVRAKKSPSMGAPLPTSAQTRAVEPPPVEKEVPPPAPPAPPVEVVAKAPLPEAPKEESKPPLPSSDLVKKAPPKSAAEEENPFAKERLEKKKGEKKGFEEEPAKFPPKDAKAKKSNVSFKRQAFSRVFDSRDKTGLRTGGDDDIWRRRKHQKQKGERSQEVIQRPTEISVILPIHLKDLAAAMKLKVSDIIQKLFLQGLTLTINDDLDDATIVELIGAEFDCKIRIDTQEADRLQITAQSVKEEIELTPSERLVSRPPVVTIMGHVDHGKTSIIDAFRKSNLVAGESGAITQHIGAFKCKTNHGEFTVLDTPGHEAFSAIRARGATVTDIVVLVVAGDEGIKPQTDEAIQKAKEAGVPIIVAINKKDKPGYNIENVYRELSERSLLPEAWGGDVITISCSAKTGEGIDHLGEMIALQSDVLELKADPTSRARGTVLESEMHRGLGAATTLLIQNGTLRLGDAIIFEHEYGRIKTMQDEHGKKLKEAPPSTPVKVTGLSGVPEAGNVFIALESEKEARNIAEERKSTMKRKQLKLSGSRDIESLLKQKVSTQDQKVLNIILKADVGGSIEAVKTTLLAIPTQKVRINFVSSDVGLISESDIDRAQASGAIIVAFHTGIESHAEALLKKYKVKILRQDVIYHLVDDVTKEMLGLLEKVRKESECGHAKVLATFKSSQVGTIAGCKVEDGVIKRVNHAKVERNKEIIWEGPISSLKRVKEDVKEVKKGLECGILLSSFKDFKENDIIRAFDVTYENQEL